jgi:hypothetical protein
VISLNFWMSWMAYSFRIGTALTNSLIRYSHRHRKRQRKYHEEQVEEENPTFLTMLVVMWTMAFAPPERASMICLRNDSGDKSRTPS